MRSIAIIFIENLFLQKTFVRDGRTGALENLFSD